MVVYVLMYSENYCCYCNNLISVYLDLESAKGRAEIEFSKADIEYIQIQELEIGSENIITTHYKSKISNSSEWNYL